MCLTSSPGGGAPKPPLAPNPPLPKPPPEPNPPPDEVFFSRFFKKNYFNSFSFMDSLLI